MPLIFVRQNQCLTLEIIDILDRGSSGALMSRVVKI